MRAAAGLSNEYRFERVFLWKFAERIRNGEFPELVLFLILWEDEDAEGILREEKQIIRASGLPAPVEKEVLGTAYLLGLQNASRRVVDAVFREDVMKLEEMGLIGERIAERLAEADLRARTEGLEEGREVGRTEEARALCFRLLRKRFGELPYEWVRRIEHADADGCGTLLERALEVETLPELWRATE